MSSVSQNNFDVYSAQSVELPHTGLSVCHNWSQVSVSPHANVKIYADMALVHVPRTEIKHQERPRRTPRGTVRQFTCRSRNRFLQRVAQVRRRFDLAMLFVTLTYPDAFPSDPELWKRHLMALRHRLARQYPDNRAFWRLELQIRKSGDFEGFLAPHFHLVLDIGSIPDTSTLQEFRTWLALAWHEIAGVGSPAHLEAGTSVEIARSRRQALGYAGKYSAKVEGSFVIVASVGRHWGYWGDWDLTEIFAVSLSYPQFVQFRRMVSKFIKSRQTKKSNGYAKRIKRARDDVGFFVFALGDQSQDIWEDEFDSTALRILLAVLD